MIETDVAPPPGHADLPRAFNAARFFIHRHVENGDGDRTAVIDEDGRYSYRNLSDRVQRCASALLGLDLRMEDRVILCLQDTVAFPTAFWGAIHAGLVPIPINTLLTPADYEYMLRDSRARALIVSAPLYDRFAGFLDRVPTLKRVVVSGGAVPGRDDLATLVERSGPLPEPACSTCDDVAFWLYTSGSTGAPKGALHTHRNLVATAELFGQGVLGLRKDDLVFSAAKLFFAYGLGNGMSFPFYAGAGAVLLKDRPTPDSVMATIGIHQPTVYFGVPTLYGSILAGSQPTGAPPHRLRLCVSAGEALPEEIGRRWEQRFGVPIVDGLGSTEMLHIFLSNQPDDVRYGTSGKAVPGYRLRIVDEDGADVPVGELGELLVSGPSSAIGYWNQREKSLRTFNGPWTRTGDKYFVDPDGYYRHAGRTDDMLKVSGNWVSPTEVESALIAHDAVLEVAVIEAKDPAGLIKPKAFVVLKDGHEPDEAMALELQNYAKARLAPYKYPRWVVFLDSLPKTATGKIQRFKLRQNEEAADAAA